MRGALAAAYGLLSYVLFLAVFLWLVVFTGDLMAPSIQRGPTRPAFFAAAVDLALLAVFSLQHSVMARKGFKRWWTRLVPTHLERSTYVLAASGALALVMGAWQPIPTVIWEVDAPWLSGVLWSVFAMGWVIVLISTFLIDHFHLFGLKQVWQHIRGVEPTSPEFRTPGLYRWVRHPLYLGFLLAFWATPRMTAGHLLFASVWTVWILLAIKLEERDLVDEHGEGYQRYRDVVPMLMPSPAKRR